MQGVAVQIRMNPKQLAVIQEIADRLGMSRPEAVRYVLQVGLSTEQVRSAMCESANSAVIVAKLMAGDIVDGASDRRGD